MKTQEQSTNETFFLLFFFLEHFKAAWQGVKLFTHYEAAVFSEGH